MGAGTTSVNTSPVAAGTSPTVRASRFGNSMVSSAEVGGTVPTATWLQDGSMILGLLSDTHGFAQRTANAVEVLMHCGAEALVHCGDVGSTGVLDALAGTRAWIVRGNTDYLDGEIARYAELLGLHFARETPLRLELAGRRLVVFHGHEPEFGRLFNGDEEDARTALGRCDYLLHGHTHVAADTRIGRLRIINPGALHRAGVYTVATLDIARDELRFWRVFDDARPGVVAVRP